MTTSSLLSTSASTTNLAANPLINQSASTSGTDATAALNYNFSEFLTLFTTQLKNQDPSNPMDTTQMTNQLAMFSQVEQQAGTNSRLDKLIAAQPTAGLASGVSYIGRTIEAAGDNISLSGGVAQIAYDMPETASGVRIDILNSAGSLVNTMAGVGTTGIQRTTWNGQDSSGNALTDGTYTVSITATNNGIDSTSIIPVPRTTGTVTGVESSSTGTVLNLGNNQVNLTDVLAVRS